MAPCRLLVGIEHVLIERPDPQRPEQVRDPLVHLFREDRVGPAHQDDVDVLRPLGRLPVERSPFCERGFMEGDRLVIRAGDAEEAYPRMDCREHPVELHLRAEHGVEVVDEGGEDPLFIGLGLLRHGRGPERTGYSSSTAAGALSPRSVAPGQTGRRRSRTGEGASGRDRGGPPAGRRIRPGRAVFPPGFRPGIPRSSRS